MESLTRLEVEFAQVRDKLYIERMGDIERERIRVESGNAPSFHSLFEIAHRSFAIGTHPELIHLTQLIEHRRRTKLDLARKTFEGLEVTYEREREADEHTVWNWWSVSTPFLAFLVAILTLGRCAGRTSGSADDYARRSEFEASETGSRETLH